MNRCLLYTSKDNKTRYYYYCKNTVNATGHKCTFRRNIEQTQIDDMLAKLITAMTKEGKFKNAIQDKIGATVDTTDLEKQLSVLNASLHQAETIKTRLEQQMDHLDVTDTHYDKKISDLQRGLDAQYDRIDEVEETRAELKSQIYELKKNKIDADSIYRFLGAFNEVYSECTDAEKKQFMQAFIERIDIFPERWEDGNWIQNIKFQFPVPIIKEGKEVAQIKDYVLKESGLKVSSLYISEVKRKCGIEVGENYNLPKSENARVPQCPKEKEDAIMAALKYFAMI